jgi:hypothetical protein
LQQEKHQSVNKFQYYEGFGDKVQNIRKKMRKLLHGKKEKGKTVAAYGAAAKGAIMLNFIGIGTDVIDYVVDRNIHKHGKYMPGLHIPIFDPSRLENELPDYVVLLPWNFKDEILAQEAGFRDKGGKFVIPIPEPVIV